MIHNPVSPWIPMVKLPASRSSAFIRLVPVALCGLLILAVWKPLAHSEDLRSETAKAAVSVSPTGSAMGNPDSFSPLWKRSMFTSKAAPRDASLDQSPTPDWLLDMQLCGWIRMDGQLKVYIRRVSTDEIMVLRADSPELPSAPRLLAIQGEDTLLDGRVQLRFNNQVAWLTLSQNAHPESPAAAPSEPVTVAATAPENAPPSAPVIEPTTIDSRAARITGPVIFDASTSYEDMMSPVDSKPKVDTKQRLLERREKLMRDFPKTPGQ
jgi:hypothetical protein